MPQAEIAQAVQLLDLMLEHFSDDGHWTRGRYGDGNGSQCLVGALLHLSRKHRLPRAPAIALLQDAMPRPGLPLVHFNDTCCDSVAELRSVILRLAALPKIIRSKSGRPPRLKPGCSPRSPKNGPRRQRLSRTPPRTSGSSPNASPPSDRSQQPSIWASIKRSPFFKPEPRLRRTSGSVARCDKLWIIARRVWTAGPRRCFL